MGQSGISVSTVCDLKCCPLWYVKFHKVLGSILWGFPMFPNAHAKPISDVSIKFSAKCFHTTYLKVVNPPSYKLVEFLHLIAVANTPTTTSEFFHPFLKFCYRFCMWLCFKLVCSTVKVKSKSKIFKSAWSVYFTFTHVNLEP